MKIDLQILGRHSHAALPQNCAIITNRSSSLHIFNEAWGKEYTVVNLIYLNPL